MAVHCGLDVSERDGVIAFAKFRDTHVAYKTTPVVRRIVGWDIVMAKWGQGDPRWIVEERPDATNVNNWHW